MYWRRWNAFTQRRGETGAQTLQPTIMPEPNRPSFVIEDLVAGLPFWLLIEQQAMIRFDCNACYHVGRWTAGDIERRFSGHPGLTLRKIGPKLRCSKCRSEWVHVARDRTVAAQPAMREA
jgi:hypothetical protein